jgi:hypothetical protein
VAVAMSLVGYEQQLFKAAAARLEPQFASP